MRELTLNELEDVSGGELSFNEGAGLILAVGAVGTMATFAFALPIAAALLYLSD